MNNLRSESTVYNTTLPPRQVAAVLPRSEGVAFCVTSLLESLAIVVMNLITIIAFARDKQLRKRKFYLVINLAVADLLVGVVAVPRFLYTRGERFGLWQNKWTFDMRVASESLENYTIYASLINLMMVSLERMYATLWPLKHHVLGRRSYYVLIGLGWTLSVFPFFFNMAERYALISLSGFFTVWLTFSCALLVISACYVSIWIKFKFGQHPQHHVNTAQDRKLTVSLFLVTAVSLATWLPSRALQGAFWLRLSSVTSLSFGTSSRMVISTSLLLFANSLVNPIIYSFRMPRYRQAIVRLFCGRSTSGMHHNKAENHV